MHVYDKIFVSMPMCMIEIENGEDDGEIKMYAYIL